jgi:magnesium-protoporphyrin IX monomethyl ester (oxidative) cyclase
MKGTLMSYFKHIVLLKAPLVYDVPQPQYVSDLIEICQLAAMIEHDVESITIPVDFYSDAAFDDFNRYLGNNPVDLVGISSITGDSGKTSA